MTQNILNPEDRVKVEEIVRKFFLSNYGSFNIESITLQGDKWRVEGKVRSFGVETTRAIVIDPETTMIVSCE